MSRPPGTIGRRVRRASLVASWGVAILWVSSYVVSLGIAQSTVTSDYGYLNAGTTTFESDWGFLIHRRSTESHRPAQFALLGLPVPREARWHPVARRPDVIAAFGFYDFGWIACGTMGSHGSHATRIPYWAVLAAVSIPCWPSLARRAIAIYRPPPAPGTCPQCGYDLRATPARCPECGAADTDLAWLKTTITIQKPEPSGSLPVLDTASKNA